jgi:GTP-binding protein
LNAFVGRRIARISATPGKTRLMNVYLIGSREPSAGSRDTPGTDGSRLPAPGSLYLLDLPGYGYARASQAERAAFRRLLAGVIARPHLTGVVWLLDIRHDPSDGDRAMQDRLAGARVPVLAALTKGDKLPPGQRRRRAEALRAATGLGPEQVLVTSARSGEGLAELRGIIRDLEQEARHATSA